MKEEVRAEIREVLENEHFREIYMNAPSENCKKYIMHQYSYEAYKDKVKYLKIRDEIEKALSKEDYKYLAENTGNNPKKLYFKEKAYE